MKFMNVILLSALSMVVSSCASNTSFINKPNIQVIKEPNSMWIINGLMTSSRNEATRISGRLTANSLYGLPRGHIDIVAYRPTGELIVETTTDYTPAILTRKTKRKGGLRFSTEIPEKLPAKAIIKVAFHRENIQQKANPLHSETIAR